MTNIKKQKLHEKTRAYRRGLWRKSLIIVQKVSLSTTSEDETQSHGQQTRRSRLGDVGAFNAPLL